MRLENFRFKDYILNEFHSLKFRKFNTCYFPLHFTTIILFFLLLMEKINLSQDAFKIILKF
ncbi:hypothetical protein BpHYR1_017939 [Brachionus plicatilis]|uniref:Uncharacterized protein n=1 Tax=Brachionus plicatilis TaxID=10195 RepID=A0A3M7Q0P9_BRAPC|nr:hypothetical protein BpHYR1_017939 [Brachionus plicatilis]